MNTNIYTAPEEIQADAEKNLPKRIHLLRSGVFHTQKYGKLEITADDIREMAANNLAGVGRPGPEGNKGPIPINFGHDKGGRAGGWVHKLEASERNDGSGIVDLYGTQIDWTGAGQQEVTAGNWKYFSSEFVPRCIGLWASAENALQKFRNVFTGVALTNVPMFSGNEGVMASTEDDASGGEQVIFINASAVKEPSMNLDTLRVKNKTDLTTEELTFVEASAESLTAEEKTKFGIVASQEGDKVTPVSIEAAAAAEGVVSVDASEVKKLVDQNAELAKQVEAANDSKTELQKTVEAHATQLKTMARASIDADVIEHGVKTGRIVADQAERWGNLIEADATMLETLKAIQPNKLVEADNIGVDDKGAGASPAEMVDAKAKELMAADDTLTLDVAYSQVMAADAELATAYNNSVTATA